MRRMNHIKPWEDLRVWEPFGPLRHAIVIQSLVGGCLPSTPKVRSRVSVEIPQSGIHSRTLYSRFLGPGEICRPANLALLTMGG